MAFDLSMFKPSAQIKLNIYNRDEVVAYTEALAKKYPSEHFRKWITSVYFNHLLTSWQSRKYVALTSFRNRLRVASIILRSSSTKAFNELYWVKSSEAPHWLASALDSGDDVVVLTFSEEDTQKIEESLDHIFDYVLDEMPDRPLVRVSYPQMLTQVADWDKRLAKMKEQIEASKDAETLNVIWKNETHYLGRLTTKQNYKLESNRMHNCVASYFNRRGTDKVGNHVYSFRTLDHEPLYTIELGVTSKIVALRQIKGRARPGHPKDKTGNRKLTNDELEAILELLSSKGLFGKGVKFYPNEHSIPSTSRAAYRRELGRLGRDDDDEEDEDWEEDEEEDEDEDDRDEGDWDDDEPGDEYYDNNE